jgi:exodeoxyribonuclease V beta subunit
VIELFDPVTLTLTGTSLVEASAGTGKTHAITLLVLRLVLERELAPSEILVMTFTEAATAELRVRIRRRLHQALEVLAGHPGELAKTEPDLLRICERHRDAGSHERLKRAVAELDEAPITTIHGFCHRVLHDHALRTGAPYGAELAKDLEELDEDVIYDFWHRYVAELPELFPELPDPPLPRLRALLREVRRHPRAELVPAPSDPLMELDRDFVRFATAELDRRKERQQVFGFDDLLARVAAALGGPGGQGVAAGLRERFKAALVDEFQDTDPVQWEIVERIFVHGGLPLFLIGDPKQAIYGFRGADVFTYLAAAGRAGRSTMRVNWRSDPGLIAAMNQLFCPAHTFVFPEIVHPRIEPRPGAGNAFFATTASEGASLEILQLERENPSVGLPRANAEYQAPRVVAAEIARLLAGGATIENRAVRAADIAVLTRNNKQCFVVQDALRDLGINSVVINDKSVWTSEEALDLERVLDGVLDPGSASARKRALATLLIGEQGDAIDRLDDEPARLEYWLEALQRWQALWAERGFLRMFRQLLRDTEAPDRLLSRQGGERRLTNLLHLGELIERAASERKLGPAALLDWLREQRQDDANRGEHTEIRLESDADAVRVLTVHKSKGLEFPIVYCPFLWSPVTVSNVVGVPRLFHEDGAAQLDVDTDKRRREEHIEIAKREAVAEEIRVAYVALTRAQHRCTLLWTIVHRCGTSAFGFVLHPDPGFLFSGDIKISRLDKVTDAEVTGALAGIAEASGGAVAVRRVTARHTAAPLARPLGDAGALAARRVEVPVGSFERTESFSGLTRHAHEARFDEPPLPDEQARDHDEEPSGDELALAVDADTATQPNAPNGAVSEPANASNGAVPEPPAAANIVLLDFPRGPRAGNFFHEIFEDIDFATATGEDVLEVATQKFESFGYAREFAAEKRDALLASAVRAVLDALDAPLAPLDFRLADVPRERRFSELEFRLPVAHEGTRSELNVARLAAVFGAHPSVAVPKSYAERLRALRFGSLRGFLKGYIDLVFCHAGRWYVVDYKTNHLGDLASEYVGARMAREMADSHYYFQYHLYTLAVDRFLRQVEPDYDYETKFGGVFYLFIKGMRPGQKTGIFHEKPPAARLAALGALLDGVGP